jgi:hypothetical protein
MDDNILAAKQTFPEISVFTSFKLSSYLDGPLEENSNFIFVTGKMFEHTAHKYTFKAGEFYIYCPFNNKMFYSIMNSDECFTNSLKWNPNFFKKIRNSFIDSEAIKHTSYTVKYEREDINEIKVTEFNDDGDLDGVVDRNIFFEINFIVESQEIVAFRLLLKPLLDDKPYITLINRLFEFEKYEDEKLREKQKVLMEKENDLVNLERQIKDTEDVYQAKKTDYLGKFYLLLQEKDKKIQALSK